MVVGNVPIKYTQKRQSGSAVGALGLGARSAVSVGGWRLPADFPGAATTAGTGGDRGRGAQLPLVAPPSRDGHHPLGWRHPDAGPGGTQNSGGDLALGTVGELAALLAGSPGAHGGGAGRPGALGRGLPGRCRRRGLQARGREPSAGASQTLGAERGGPEAGEKPPGLGTAAAPPGPRDRGAHPGRPRRLDLARGRGIQPGPGQDPGPGTNLPIYSSLPGVGHGGDAVADRYALQQWVGNPLGGGGRQWSGA